MRQSKTRSDVCGVIYIDRSEVYGGHLETLHVGHELVELGRRIAGGFRNFEHYRLRMLLITGGLDASLHTQL